MIVRINLLVLLFFVSISSFNHLINPLDKNMAHVIETVSWPHILFHFFLFFPVFHLPWGTRDWVIGLCWKGFYGGTFKVGWPINENRTTANFQYYLKPEGPLKSKFKNVHRSFPSIFLKWKAIRTRKRTLVKCEAFTEN